MKPNHSPTSRRAALTQLGAAGALVGLTALGHAAEPASASTGSLSYGLNVRNCGAVGDVQATHALLRGQGRATFVGCHFYQVEGPFVPQDFTDEGHAVI